MPVAFQSAPFGKDPGKLEADDAKRMLEDRRAGIKNNLFLGAGNSARSIMAEALMNPKSAADPLRDRDIIRPRN